MKRVSKRVRDACKILANDKEALAKLVKTYMKHTNKRKPITKIKDGRNDAYKAGKEVGYYEGMMDAFKRTLDTSSLGYLMQNRETVADLIKKYKDTSYKDYGSCGQKRVKFSWE